MNPSEAMMLLTDFGYNIDCGYVFCGKYRYGRIFEEAFVPEGNFVIPIPWEDIKTFTGNDHSEMQGKVPSTRIHGSRSHSHAR